MRQWVGVALTGLLVAINALLVAAEFAFVRVRPSRLETLRQGGNRRAATALGLARRLDATLATTQVGITLASLGIGWMGEASMAALLDPVFEHLGLERWTHPVAFGAAFLVITLATVVLGELVPKALGIQAAEPIALYSADVLFFIRRVLYPLVAFTNRCALAVLKLAGVSSLIGSETAHTDEELRTILSLSHERGHLSRIGRDVLDRALGFSRLTARQIMVPRPDVVWLSTKKEPAENVEIARASGYTRFPLCGGDLDHVAGIVHIKDLLPRQGGPPDLIAVMRPPIVVPETATADRLLRLFQRRALHMAIVVDEYGGTAGILTLEDVIEEIVGEVQDEFDEEPPAIAPGEEGRFAILGSARLEEAARALGVAGESDVDEEVDTIAGYVQAKLGRIARMGDEVPLGHYVLRVDQVRGNRIIHLIAVRMQPADARDEPPAVR